MRGRGGAVGLPSRGKERREKKAVEPCLSEARGKGKKKKEGEKT